VALLFLSSVFAALKSPAVQPLLGTWPARAYYVLFYLFLVSSLQVEAYSSSSTSSTKCFSTQ
jgi:hypothetical protein